MDPPLAPLPTIEERRQTSREIGEAYNATPLQFTVIVLGVSIVGAGAMIALVGVAALVKEATTAALIIGAILTVIGSLATTIISAVTKIRVERKVEEVKERLDGRMDEMLELTKKNAEFFAVRQERKKVAELKAETDPRPDKKWS